MPSIVNQDEIGLTRKLADALEPIASEIRKSGASAVENVLRVGGLLKQAQGKLAKRGNGTFGRWVEARCGMGRNTAIKMIRVAQQFGEVCIPEIQTFETTALYTLSTKSCPEAARDEALAIAKQGEHVTAKVARQLIDKHTPEPEEIADNASEEAEYIPFKSAVERWMVGMDKLLPRLRNDMERVMLLKRISNEIEMMRPKYE